MAQLDADILAGIIAASNDACWRMEFGEPVDLTALAPFGGAGLSGVGRELSQWFLETFTEKKLIVFDLGGDRYNRRAEGGW